MPFPRRSLLLLLLPLSGCSVAPVTPESHVTESAPVSDLRVEDSEAPVVLEPGPKLPRPILLRDFYEVEGESLGEIEESMRRRGPYGHDGYTSWYVGWKYTFLWSDDECFVTSFWTTVQVRYAMPKLVENPNHSLALLAEWERYLEALREHEEGHAALALEAAAEMERVVLENHMVGTSRKELSDAIDASCRAALKRARTREQAYDRNTEHGRTQGARLRVF